MMALKAGSTPWRWATESGEQHVGSEQELVMCLSSRALPTYTLVWRAGWAEWLPALQVVELARGLPRGSAHMARVPRLAAGRSEPPPPPFLEYPRLKLWAQQLETLGATTVVPEQKATPAAGFLDDFEEVSEHEEVTSEIPPAIMQQAARVMTAPSPPSDLGLRSDSVVRGDSLVRSDSAPGGDLRSGASRSSRPPPPDGEAVVVAENLLTEEVQPLPALDPSVLFPAAEFPSLPELANTPSSSAHTATAHSFRWLLLVAALVVGVALWLTREQWVARIMPFPSGLEVAVLTAQPTSQPSAVREPLPPAPKAALACRVLEPANKIDDWASPDVPFAVAALPGGSRLAIGYAQSFQQALGVVLDTKTFAVERRFVQARDQQISSVTPLVASGTLEFRVERMGSEVAFGAVVDQLPPLRVGMNGLGIVGGPLGRPLQFLWALPKGVMMSPPVFAPHPLGSLVAARVARGDGNILLGLLSKEGVAQGGSSELALPAGRVGLPALASTSDGVALAVAVQRAEALGDLLLLARVSGQELPRVAAPVDSLTSAPVQIRNPALAALDTRGFVLTWSEGSGWQRRVRMLTLDTELKPAGAPSDVSKPDPALRGAMNGSLYRVGDRVLSFYFIRRSEGYGLWAQSLDCGDPAH
jgi:hypothetical protein